MSYSPGMGTRGGWIWAGCAMVFCPAAASAHFLWAEPSATPEREIRVFFGEYPALREGAPQLEKMSGVRLFALERGGRRELKRVAREANHFLYRVAGDAPVVVGSLDYGVVDRQGSPPFRLRYETQVILGEGKPQPLAALARYGNGETGLPLVATMEASSGNHLKVRVSLRGKPAPAHISLYGPRDTDTMVVKTDSAGVLEMRLKEDGWQHLRIGVDDDTPIFVGGKEAKFTRTYLSVMFNASLWASEPGLAGAKVDAEAGDLLKAAHDARASWQSDFPGFSADAVYRHNGKEARGTITVNSDFSVMFELGDKELEAALRPSFGSLIMHRRKGDSKLEYQGTWRDDLPHVLGRAINLNDSLGSFYRIRDRQILEVNRVIGSQRFTTTVLENESTRLGFLPRTWCVAYYEKDSNKLLRTSTLHADWIWKGDVFLPSTLQVVVAHDAGTEVSRLELTHHRLLR